MAGLLVLLLGTGAAAQAQTGAVVGRVTEAQSGAPLGGAEVVDGGFPAELSGTGVDGFLTGAVSAFAANGANITTTPLDIISVGDIERIEIVKGPAATTLFGTGAGNGVIQIFTRTGRPGGPRWTAAVVQGTGWVRPFGANGIDYFHIEHFLRDAWWGGGYEGGAYSQECVTDDERWQGVNSSPEGACSWPGAQWYQTYRLSAGGRSGKLTY